MPSEDQTSRTAKSIEAWHTTQVELPTKLSIMIDPTSSGDRLTIQMFPCVDDATLSPERRPPKYEELKQITCEILRESWRSDIDRLCDAIEDHYEARFDRRSREEQVLAFLITYARWRMDRSQRLRDAGMESAVHGLSFPDETPVEMCKVREGLAYVFDFIIMCYEREHARHPFTKYVQLCGGGINDLDFTYCPARRHSRTAASRHKHWISKSGTGWELGFNNVRIGQFDLTGAHLIALIIQNQSQPLSLNELDSLCSKMKAHATPPRVDNELLGTKLFTDSNEGNSEDDERREMIETYTSEHSTLKSKLKKETDPAKRSRLQQDMKDIEDFVRRECNHELGDKFRSNANKKVRDRLLRNISTFYETLRMSRGGREAVDYFTDKVRYNKSVHVWTFTGVRTDWRIDL